MDSRVTVAVALLVVTAGVAVTGPVAGAAVADETATPTATPVAENGTNESEFGATVSAFMQASAAETAGSVDNGMWVASFNRANASERPELVQNRTAALERRAARLEAERAALLNESDGEVTVQERAKAARLAARIDALRDAINTTAEAAAETGVNRTRLDELRNKAGELSGPEVARMARNLTFGPPGQAKGGGPDGAPGTDQPGNAGDRPGNSTDETGQSTDGNATDDEARNGTADGGDAGNGPGSAGGSDGQDQETEDD